jgi:hypothetical protein
MGTKPKRVLIPIESRVAPTRMLAGAVLVLASVIAAGDIPRQARTWSLAVGIRGLRLMFCEGWHPAPGIGPSDALHMMVDRIIEEFDR